MEEGKRIEARAVRERWRLLLRLERWLETPMLVLAAVWLVLLVLELTRGLSPARERLGTAIWIAFVAEFAVRFLVAPRRGRYLRRNWLTAVSLVLPALRVVRVVALARVLRASQAVRGMQLVRVVASLNRGMRTLDRGLRRRGFRFVAGLTVLVALVGAAALYFFERGAEGGGLPSYGEALWWTTMLLTTTGTEYWPRTAEGRAVVLGLSVYAVSIFGYLAATLASAFIDRDARDRRGGVAGRPAIDALRAEVAALREELRRERGAATRASPD